MPPDTTGLDHTRAWLTQIAWTHTAHNGMPWSPAQWLMDNALPVQDWSPLPKGVRRRQPKLCYWNSQQVAKRGRGRYVYCEGYATRMIPVEHAWCLDRETGLIVDTTWGEGGHAYCGVPVKLAYAQQCFRNDRVSVWDWTGGFPIMTGAVPVAEWREIIS